MTGAPEQHNDSIELLGQPWARVSSFIYLIWPQIITWLCFSSVSTDSSPPLTDSSPPLTDSTRLWQIHPRIWQSHPRSWQIHPRLWQIHPRLWQFHPRLWQIHPSLWQIHPCLRQINPYVHSFYCFTKRQKEREMAVVLTAKITTMRTATVFDSIVHLLMITGTLLFMDQSYVM